MDLPVNDQLGKIITFDNNPILNNGNDQIGLSIIPGMIQNILNLLVIEFILQDQLILKIKSSYPFRLEQLTVEEFLHMEL